MAIAVHDLDVMNEGEAAEMLRSCCGSSRWAGAMAGRRPFRSREAVFAAADEVWAVCSTEDWLEAFAHHPRIGEKKGAGLQSARAAAWSEEEQSATGSASVTVQDEMADVNRAYEARFGYRYIVCATGKSADEMLAIARARMSNDATAELRVAAEEQRKITQVRLRKLFGSEA